MADNIGIRLDEDFDLDIHGGTFRNGDTTLDETGVVLGLNQGQLRNDPLLGPNLKRLMRSVGGERKASTAAKIHLTRDGKDYGKLKKRIKLDTE